MFILRMVPTINVILNGFIFFSYFYLEDNLTCFSCTEQIKRVTSRLNFDLYFIIPVGRTPIAYAEKG